MTPKVNWQNGTCYATVALIIMVIFVCVFSSFNMESYLDFKLQLTNPIESENNKEGMFGESLCTKQQVIGSWSLTTSKFKKTIASR